MNDNNSPKSVGRRHTLQLFGLGLASSSLLVLAGCGNKGGGGSGDTKGTSAAGTGCDTPVDEQAKANRRALQYQDKAADPNKQCKACAQFEAKKYGDCGGCKVLPGPVKPEGGCLAFAPAGAPANSKG